MCGDGDHNDDPDNNNDDNSGGGDYDKRPYPRNASSEFRRSFDGLLLSVGWKKMKMIQGFIDWNLESDRNSK